MTTTRTEIVTVSELLDGVRYAVGNEKITVPRNASLQDKLLILQQITTFPQEDYYKSKKADYVVKKDLQTRLRNKEKAHEEWVSTESRKFNLTTTGEDNRSHKQELARLREKVAEEPPLLNDYKERQHSEYVFFFFHPGSRYS